MGLGLVGDRQLVVNVNLNDELQCNCLIKQITLHLVSCVDRVMASTSEKEEILEAAVAGIQRVAEAVAASPEEVRAEALDAVENSYRRTARDFGYDEDLIQSWVSTIMLRLRAELERRELAKQKVLEALGVELLQAPKSNVLEHKEGRRVTAKRNRRRRSPRRPGVKALRSVSS